MQIKVAAVVAAVSRPSRQLSLRDEMQRNAHSICSLSRGRLGLVVPALKAGQGEMERLRPEGDVLVPSMATSTRQILRGKRQQSANGSCPSLLNCNGLLHPLSMAGVIVLPNGQKFPQARHSCVCVAGTILPLHARVVR